MSPRTRFIVVGVVLAAVLYAALRLAMGGTEQAWWLGYATAAVAVMLAAQGVSWPRKLLFAGATSAVCIGLFVLVSFSPLIVGADILRTSSIGEASHLLIVAFVIVQLIFLGVPLGALALFVGGRPSVLWTKP